MGSPFFPPDKATEKLGKKFEREILPHQIRFTVFHGCCGFHEIYGWETIPTADLLKHRDKVLAFLQNDRNFWRGYSDPPAALVTTIAEYQVHPMSQLFKEAGYTLMGKGTNMKTHNSVFMYVKTLNETTKTGVA